MKSFDTMKVCNGITPWVTGLILDVRRTFLFVCTFFSYVVVTFQVTITTLHVVVDIYYLLSSKYRTVYNTIVFVRE